MLSSLLSYWKRKARVYAAQAIVLSPVRLTAAILLSLVGTIGLGGLLVTTYWSVNATTAPELLSQLDGPAPVLLYALGATIAGIVAGQSLLVFVGPAWLRDDYPVSHPASLVILLILLVPFVVVVYYLLVLLDGLHAGLGLLVGSYLVLGMVWGNELWNLGSPGPSRTVGRKIVGSTVLVAAFGAVVVGGLGPSLSLESWRVVIAYIWMTTISIAAMKTPITTRIGDDLKMALDSSGDHDSRPVAPEPWRPIETPAVDVTPSGPLDGYLGAAARWASDTDAIIDFGVAYEKLHQHLDGSLHLWAQVGDLDRPETVAAILAFQLHPGYYDTKDEQARAAAILEDTYQVLVSGSAATLVEALGDGDLLAEPGPTGERLDRIEAAVAAGLSDDDAPADADEQADREETSGDGIESEAPDEWSGGTGGRREDEVIPPDIDSGGDGGS